MLALHRAQHGALLTIPVAVAPLLFGTRLGKPKPWSNADVEVSAFSLGDGMTTIKYC